MLNFVVFQRKSIFGGDYSRFNLASYVRFLGDNLYLDRFLAALSFLLFFLATVTVWGCVFCRI
jgi:hypothetical protein